MLEGGVQCGFCIPGIVVRATALIRQGVTDDRAAIAKALDGHICRCTGYGRIIDAIQTAGEACENGGHLPDEPRRHLFFGEEFGLRRNPAFSGNGNGNGHGSGIGHSMARLGGVEQALGDKPFVDDMRAPGMLHGAMVLSEHPRAKVLGIHTDAAMAAPGVVRVLTAADVPGERGVGLNVPDLPIFVAVGEVTCCVGDFLAMVVADTQFHARQAAERVKVDYEVLEPVTDPFEALKEGAVQVHSSDTLYPTPNLIDTTKFSRGDVEAALASSAHVVERTFRTQPIDPAFLEPEACLAIPLENGIRVHTESQGSIFDQKQIAKVLNMPLERVEIVLAASGGAFGAKEELSIQAQTAVAAHLLRRPVKTVLTRAPVHAAPREASSDDAALHGGRRRRGPPDRRAQPHRRRRGRLRGTSGKCLLRAACHSCGLVPGSQRRRRIACGLHEQPHERRHAGLRQQPGAVRDGRHDGHHRRARRRGRLRHPRAKSAQPG